MVASAIALQALLEDGDPRFLDAVLETTEADPLRGLAERWYARAKLPNPEPEARRALLAYIDDGLLRPNHPPLAKRLFKQIEAADDREAMAHVLVACDRMARRRLVNRSRYDWQARSLRVWSAVVPEAAIPRRSPTRKMAPVGGRAPKPPKREVWDPWTGKRSMVEQDHLPTFTFRTRRYLARRAWRYFRGLAVRTPEAYRDAITVALSLYDDPDLADPIALLDAWGLVHALYHHSPVVMQTRRGWEVQPGFDLAQIAPAPYAPDVWKAAPEPLFDLAARARSRPVRRFALQQLRAFHGPALKAVPIDRVRRFLSSPHEEVMAFGAELFAEADGLAQLSVDEWRALLGITNPFALPAIVEAFETLVAPTRLSDADLIELAASRAAPVAALALSWLRDRPVPSREDLVARLALAEVPADTVRADAAAWLCTLLRTRDDATAADLRGLLDGRFRDVRAAALEAFGDTPRYAEDVGLWSDLAETPYDDVKDALLRHLDARQANLTTEAEHRLWAGVLLAIHRGSRAKIRASRQIAARLVRAPDRIDALLPLLAVSLKSLRRPERRSALAAVARAAFAHPQLGPKLEAALPRLSLRPEPRSPGGAR